MLSPSWGSTTDAYNWRYLFQGMRCDPVTGLYKSLTRDLNPATGTWMEADGGYCDGSNLYQGFDGEPLNNTDPTGASPQPTWIGDLLNYAIMQDIEAVQAAADEAYNRSAFHRDLMIAAQNETYQSDSINAFFSSHGGPGSKGLDDDAVGPSDGLQKCERFRDRINAKGGLKEENYVQTDGEGADAVGGAAATGIQMFAQGLNEWLNGMDTIEVRYWNEDGASGFYVSGMDPNLAKTLITLWTGVDVTNR